MTSRILAGVLLAACCLSAAHATSVVPPSFAELISEAQMIVRAKVKSVRCAWVEAPQGRVIKTFVTLSVLKRLKGEAGEELTLQFLGGEVDGESMQVAGMPHFVEGKMEIVFVAGNGVRFCPLIAMMHGRYRVLTDEATAREYVARDNGIPLESENDVKLPQEHDNAADRFGRVSAALSPSVFEQKILAEVTRHVTQP